jgi:hypothetical protein
VNYTSSLSKTMVKEMVKEELRKGMESISKWGYALWCSPTS